MDNFAEQAVNALFQYPMPFQYQNSYPNQSSYPNQNSYFVPNIQKPSLTNKSQQHLTPPGTTAIPRKTVRIQEPSQEPIAPEPVPAKKTPAPRLRNGSMHSEPPEYPNSQGALTRITPKIPSSSNQSAPSNQAAGNNRKKNIPWLLKFFCTTKAGEIKNSHEDPIWSPEESTSLNSWVRFGIGPEERAKAVMKLTQCKKYKKENLNLKNLSLKNINSFVFTMNIKKLNISNNSLKSLSPSISRLSQLVHLNASYNELTDIPQEIGHLIQLEELNLSNNELNTLPELFERLQLLEKLYLDNNKFTDYPEEISNLRNLKIFSIAQNKLTQTPNSMNYMKSLLHLNMANNNIDTLSKTWDLLLKQLITLNLSNNMIGTLPFNDIPKKMKKLDLSFNPIAGLPLTFGPLMWAEKGKIKTTHKIRNNMRIKIQETNLIAGLSQSGRLEINDMINSHPIEVLPVPHNGASVDETNCSDIQLEEWDCGPTPWPENVGIEGISEIVETKNSDSNSSNSSSNHSPTNLEKNKKDFFDKMYNVADWLHNDINERIYPQK